MNLYEAFAKKETVLKSSQKVNSAVNKENEK